MTGSEGHRRTEPAVTPMRGSRSLAARPADAATLTWNHLDHLDRGCENAKTTIPTFTAMALPSGLRDHEHDGHDGKGDAADGEQPDDAEVQRDVAAGPQRLLQLALALRADDQQPDRE